MLELLNLPNELLLHIVKMVLPDDIENFSQSCRLIHSLSRDVLREHAANKQKYSKITIGALDTPYENPTLMPPLLSVDDSGYLAE